MTFENPRGEGTHLAALPRSERVFLWSLRAWSVSYGDLSMVWPQLERVFSQEQMGCALQPFHEFMSTLFGSLVEWPDIRCLRFPLLGRHEALLLEVFGCLQRDDEITARRALNAWLPGANLRALVRHGSACTKGAKAAGLLFESPPTAMRVSVDAAAANSSAILSFRPLRLVTRH